MTVLSEEILKDLELARKVITTEACNLVVVKYEKIWKKKKGEGVKPILEAIVEMGGDINGSVIGERTLGKASALLCRYAKASGVYSTGGTKTAIAILIMGGVPCQVDKMIPFIQKNEINNQYLFEKILNKVDSPEEAFAILKEKLL
jgi:hypothetical protein